MRAAPGLVGNRLALAGAVLYSLEWVAIAFIPEVGTERFGKTPPPSSTQKSGPLRSDRLRRRLVRRRPAWADRLRGGFARAFRDSGQDSLLADLAVGAMIVSVALEIASFAPTAAGGWIADTQARFVCGRRAGRGGERDGPPGLRSAWRIHPGGVGGDARFGPVPALAGCARPARPAAGVVEGSRLPCGRDLVEALGFWVWLIATSVILWRRAPRRAAAA